MPGLWSPARKNARQEGIQISLSEMQHSGNSDQKNPSCSEHGQKGVLSVLGVMRLRLYDHQKRRDSNCESKDAPWSTKVKHQKHSHAIEQHESRAHARPAIE